MVRSNICCLRSVSVVVYRFIKADKIGQTIQYGAPKLNNCDSHIQCVKSTSSVTCDTLIRGHNAIKVPCATGSFAYHKERTQIVAP